MNEHTYDVQGSQTVTINNVELRIELIKFCISAQSIRKNISS